MKSKRTMMSQETIPSLKKTNGGNGAYMKREIMKEPKGGLTKPMTATARRSVKAL